MKQLIMLVLLAAGATVQAQENNIHEKLRKALEKYRETHPGQLNLKGDTLVMSRSQSRISADSLIFKIMSQNDARRLERVKYLRQDNMPCVVPNTKDIAAIPNAAPAITIPFPTTIPNPTR